MRALLLSLLDLDRGACLIRRRYWGGMRLRKGLSREWSLDFPLVFAELETYYWRVSCGKGHMRNLPCYFAHLRRILISKQNEETRQGRIDSERIEPDDDGTTLSSTRRT